MRFLGNIFGMEKGRENREMMGGKRGNTMGDKYLPDINSPFLNSEIPLNLTTIYFSSIYVIAGGFFKFLG